MMRICLQGDIIDVNDNFLDDQNIVEEKKIGETYFLKIKKDISKALPGKSYELYDGGIISNIYIHKDFYIEYIRNKKIENILK